MLYLESFTHRDELSEIISRWFVNHPAPGDVGRIKRIVNFNSYMARIWVDHLMRGLLTGLHGVAPRARPMRVKADLKDLIVGHPLGSSPRIDELRARYRRFPEDFYRETPVDGSLYVAGDDQSPRFLGATRIKRYRRIAEKGSRRIVEFLLENIRTRADELAAERAARIGLPKDALLTPSAQMAEEFAHAERRVVKAIRTGSIRDELPDLALADVVGIKLIAEDQDYPRLLALLAADPDLEVTEEQRHSGRYNAVNLRVSYRLPRQLLAANPPAGAFQRVLEFRGLPGDRISEDYQEHLRAAEERVDLEIIVANFQEFLESEIGLSMHEERIVEQRSSDPYNGPLATNARSLMLYILTLCRAPGPEELDDVPIKMWVKYMPDTVEQIMMLLFVEPQLYLDALDPPV